MVLCATAATAGPNPYSAESAIYKIEVPSPNGSQIGLGTGVLIASDKILTNCHVVKGNGGWPRVIAALRCTPADRRRPAP